MPLIRIVPNPTNARRMAAALLPALALAGGCRTAGIYRPDVQMQLTADHAGVPAGRALGLAVTLTNPAADTLVLEFKEDCRVALMIMDTAGNALHPGASDPPCLTAGGGRVVLAGGASWTAAGEWTPITRDGAAAPGAYRVRAVLGEHDSVRRGRRDPKMAHSGDTLAFRVLPPAAR